MIHFFLLCFLDPVGGILIIHNCSLSVGDMIIFLFYNCLTSIIKKNLESEKYYSHELEVPAWWFATCQHLLHEFTFP